MKKAKKQIVAISVPAQIFAQEPDQDGKRPPAKFEAAIYTGGAMEVGGFEFPVAIDLAGLKPGKILVANLDHDSTKRVGNFELQNDGSVLSASGTATAATAAAREVVESALQGYQWQASVEVTPAAIEEFDQGESVTLNGQQLEGPLFVVRRGKLSGFAFVSHGADDNTTVSVAASAVSKKEQKKMKAELRKWIEAKLPGVDIEELSAEAIANLEADYNGQSGVRKPKQSLESVMEAKAAEVKRVEEITEIAAAACDARPFDIEAIKKIAADAIDEKWSAKDFRLALFEAATPPATTRYLSTGNTGKNRITDEVVEAALCQAGRLKDHEKQFNDQALQAAHDRFKGRIGLKQLIVMAAEANGMRCHGDYNVTLEMQRAAFGMMGPTRIQASGFSTLSLPNILSNVANKFLRQGFNAVDQTPLRIAAVKPVNDFKTHTTVSLTGDFTFRQVGADGELTHAKPGEEVYTNKADTYGRIFSVTRTNIINDDLDALTSVPRKIGRGAMLKLNNIFWTVFLNNSAFFTAGRNNVSTDTGALGLVGLQQAEAIFIKQTDPDGEPLGIMPAILLVPPSLKTLAMELMEAQLKITGENTTLPNANVWQGRFQVETSPYMENSSYTGNSAVAWYLLADPEDLPVVEIAALFGRVEPFVETADAAFNVLGIEMRGYSDVGVAMQEYRGGVRADGSAAD